MKLTFLFSQDFSQKVVSINKFFVFNSARLRRLLLPLQTVLDPDQAQQNVGHVLGQNCLTPGWY